MRRKKERMQFDIRKVGVSRAVYQGINETARMQFFLIASNGIELEFELDSNTARTLIEQCIATYYIINPPLKTTRSQFGL